MNLKEMWRRLWSKRRKESPRVKGIKEALAKPRRRRATSTKEAK